VHVFAHPRDRPVEGHRKPALDVGLDLRAQAEDDKSARSQAAWAVTIGLRGNATAIPGPASIRSAAASAAPQVRKGLCLVSVTHMPAKPDSSTARAVAAASPSGRPSGK
jgi:hypothetical protein